MSELNTNNNTIYICLIFVPLGPNHRGCMYDNDEDVWEYGKRRNVYLRSRGLQHASTAANREQNIPAYRARITPHARRVSIRSCCCWSAADWRARKRTDHRKEWKKWNFVPEVWSNNNNINVREGKGEG